MSDVLEDPSCMSDALERYRRSDILENTTYIIHTVKHTSLTDPRRTVRHDKNGPMTDMHRCEAFEHDFSRLHLFVG